MNRRLLPLLSCGLLPFAWAFSSPAATPPERIIIAAEAGNGVAIVDPGNGIHQVLWQYPVEAVHDLHLLPDFHILTQSGWTNLIEIDLQKKIQWRYNGQIQNRDDGLKHIQIHAFQRLPDGVTMIAESGASRIIEVDPSGEILRQFPLVVSRSNTHSDTRLVRKLENGNYLVAHEADQMVKEYSPDGKVVWEFPIPLFGKKLKSGHGPEAFGGRCFSAIKAKNGNFLITTGNGHSVLEVTPSKNIVWKLDQNDIPGVTLAWVTTIQERPNGNLIIGNCHAGPNNPQIIEVNRDKNLVWSFKDFKIFGNALANSIVLDGKRALALRDRLQAQN